MEWRDVCCVACLHCMRIEKGGNDSVSIVSVRVELSQQYAARISHRIKSTRSLLANAKIEYENKVHRDNNLNAANTFAYNSKELDRFPIEKSERIVRNQVDFSVKLPTFKRNRGEFLFRQSKTPSYSHVIQYVFSFSVMEII